MPEPRSQCQVGLILGSEKDWEVVKGCAETLRELGISFEVKVLSAHRTPEETAAYAREAAGRGLRVIVAAAGYAAHLPGVIAAYTELPVIGVPVTGLLDGLDALLSMVQMPRGVPVATVAVGKAGAVNAALLAARILALENPGLAGRLRHFREEMRRRVLSAAESLASGIEIEKEERGPAK